jgi:cell division septation protein DedD
MQRGLGGTVFEPVQPPERVDRELTLGPFMLTLIGCGLFGLCGLCFVFGYAVGHRNAESSTAISVPPVAAPSLMQQVSAQSKPAAGQSGTASVAADPADPSATAATDAAGTPPLAADDQAGAPASGAAATASQPALPASSAATLGQGNVMVQIAAVSHPEDADVLVGALRKRGYAVTARRDPTDGLLHVQVGPFANRNDAYAMRQKLLNDGYNAMVQP